MLRNEENRRHVSQMLFGGGSTLKGSESSGTPRFSLAEHGNWNWNETGTAHEPGIQPADVAELLDHGATTIVLSKGMFNRLGICPQTLQLLEEHRIQTHALPTKQAVELYNRLCESDQVAGLFHTTC